MAYIAVPSSSSERQRSEDSCDELSRDKRPQKRSRCKKLYGEQLGMQQLDATEGERGVDAVQIHSHQRKERTARKSKKAKKMMKKAKKEAKQAKKARKAMKAKEKRLASSGTASCSGARIEVLSSPNELSSESGSEVANAGDPVAGTWEGHLGASASPVDVEDSSGQTAVAASTNFHHDSSSLQTQPPQTHVTLAHVQQSSKFINSCNLTGSAVRENSTGSDSVLPRLSELRNALARSNHTSESRIVGISRSDGLSRSCTDQAPMSTPRLLEEQVPPNSVVIAISEDTEEVLRLAGQSAAELASERMDRNKVCARSRAAAFHSECPHVTAPQVPPPISRGGALWAQRTALPVFAHRDNFLETLQKHQVIVVEGDTGCGKSTQLPQYVLEESSAKKQPCNIIVTQPRRISAIGVAERVAEECGTQCGHLVGYSIRMDTVSSRATMLLFCTVGVLLRRLESDPALQGLTHIFVDEVHERSVEIDLLLLALFDVRRQRPELWIILMSATLESDVLSEYYDGAPRFKIPGRTFPVKTLFLEDALEMTSHVVETYADWASRIRTSNRRYSKEVSYSGIPAQSDGEKREDLSQDVVRDRYFKYSIGVRKALSALDHGAVNYDLAAQIVAHFLNAPAPQGPTGEEVGAILVFLSGAKEIQTMRSALLSAVPVLAKEPACSWILTLHSSLPQEQQRLAFAKPPAGVRKIVLATNIAETSITIDDVGIVVDTAHVKELRYDMRKRLASLEDVIVSRASARQRRGRAGRVAPGTCVHLVTKYCHDRLLEPHQLAEVQRVPLEQLVLQIHATGLHQGAGAEVACSRLLQPPDRRAVRQSVKELIDLGALAKAEGENSEELTCLGKLLGDLPMDARMGKLILIGLAFGRSVFDAILTVAASLTIGSPLAWSWDHKYEAQRAHRSFGEKLITGDLSCSDVLAMLQAYQEWERLEHRERAEFCRTQFLRPSILFEVSKMKDQLHDILHSAGLLNWQRHGHRARSWSLGKGHSKMCGQGFAPLVTALLCAALFPQLVLVVPKESCAPSAGESRCYPVELFVEDVDARCSDGSRPGISTGGPSLMAVHVHPSSVVAREKLFGTPYLIYNRLVQTARLYVHDVTPVPPLTLAIFAGACSRGVFRLEQQCYQGHSVIAIGSCLRFALPTPACKIIIEIRAALDRLWRMKLERNMSQGRQMQEQSSDVCTTKFVEHLSELLSMPVA